MILSIFVVLVIIAMPVLSIHRNIDLCVLLLPGKLVQYVVLVV